MSPKVTDRSSTRNQIPLKDRCRFTSAHGRRCLNPLRSGTAGFCIIHERFEEQRNDAEALSVSDQLLAGGPDLKTREEVGRVIAKLFILIAQKRIRQRDGALLAYVASLLLQTMGLAAAPPREPVRFICDLPGPERERIPIEPRSRPFTPNQP